MDPADLFGLPLDRFVPERTALARALRSEGRGDEAADVARTRKPSVAALEDEARAAVGGGCLTRELRHIGLGVQAGQPKPEAAPARATKSAPAAGRGSKSAPISARGPKSDPASATPSTQRAEARRIER